VNEDINSIIHELSNKLIIIEGKTKKISAICTQEEVIVEIEKLLKNVDLSITLLQKLKGQFS
jgi:hypothetical protein